LIFVCLLFSVGLRILRKNTLKAILTIIADVLLIGLTVETVIADNLLDTLKNFIGDPGITLTIICIALMAWNWVKLIGSLKKLQTGNST
jgi:hypothetical protein